LVGVGLKVTGEPAQTGVAEAAIFTAGVTFGFTVIIIELEVAVGDVAQAAVDVITQLITSLFAKIGLLKLGPVTAVIPLTFH
jgi:hypothetical protein